MNNFEFKQISEYKFPEKVYYIKSDKDQTVLWGMDVSISGNVIRWFDGNKERAMKIKNKTHNDDGSFSFEREDGEHGAFYELNKMTLSIYNENVKQNLAVPEEFSSEEDMLSSFEKSANLDW